MLALGRTLGQSIVIRNADGKQVVRFTLTRINSFGTVRMEFDAEPSIEINRAEIDAEKQARKAVA